MNSQRGLTILIPCLNEYETITSVIGIAVKALKKANLIGKVVVSDNGSTDGSRQLIEKQGIAKVIEVPIRGYGAALHWGIMNSKTEYVLFADADMSYDFNELNRFVPYLNGKYDLILGSRFKGSIKTNAMPFLNRYIGTPILTWLINVIYGIRTSDCNSGMRAVRVDFYKMLEMKNVGMEWASELLIKTALHNGRYIEVPISLHPDKRSRPPHLLRWADGWRHLKAIVLLKPATIIWAIVFWGTISAWLIPWYSNFAFLGFLICEILFYTMLSAYMLHALTSDIYKQIAQRILNLPLIPIAALLSLLALISTLYLHESYSFIVLLFVSSVAILDMWVFFVETIKTHLILRLPGSIE